jgi:hypothetical protein
MTTQIAGEEKFLVACTIYITWNAVVFVVIPKISFYT